MSRFMVSLLLEQAIYFLARANLRAQLEPARSLARSSSNPARLLLIAKKTGQQVQQVASAH